MSFVTLAEASSPYVLALDAGSSSVRALAFDLAGRAIQGAEAQFPYTIDTTPDGGATADAAMLFDLTVLSLDGLVASLGDAAANIAVAGTTSFWHSLLGVDRAGEPVTPVYYWADTRSAPDALALRDILDPTQVWQRTGCRLHPSYWPAKLRWLQRTAPDLVERVHRWCSFPEYALSRLCNPGAEAVTNCMASGTGLLDVHTLNWDDELLAISGISPDHLSPKVDLGPASTLQPNFAARWPTLRGVAWYPALGDGACANVGSGAVGSSRIALTVGTSAAMRLILPRDPAANWSIPAGLWAYRLDSRRAVLGGALSNGGNLLRWIWETTGCGPQHEATLLAGELPPDSTGLTILPFLAGERSPSWYDDAHGAFAGVTLATRPADMIRGGMESVSYRLAAIYDSLSPLADAEHEILVGGGGILELPAWLQITADVLGHPLLASDPASETSARGAALMAAEAAGLIPDLDGIAAKRPDLTLYAPDAATYATYRRARARQVRLEEMFVHAGEYR